MPQASSKGHTMTQLPDEVNGEYPGEGTLIGSTKYIAGFHSQYDSFKIYNSRNHLLLDLLDKSQLAQWVLTCEVPAAKEYYVAGVGCKRESWVFFDNEPEALAHRNKFFHFWSLAATFLYRVPQATETRYDQELPPTNG